MLSLQWLSTRLNQNHKVADHKTTAGQMVLKNVSKAEGNYISCRFVTTIDPFHIASSYMIYCSHNGSD